MTTPVSFGPTRLVGPAPSGRSLYSSLQEEEGREVVARKSSSLPAIPKDHEVAVFQIQGGGTENLAIVNFPIQSRQGVGVCELESEGLANANILCWCGIKRFQCGK